VQGAENRSLLLGDVAQIVEDHQLLIGDAVVNDTPSLMLVVERFPGASVSQVTSGVENALDAMRPGLQGIEIDTRIYRPASFIERMVDNLTTALVIGLILLVLVLGAVLFDWRAALVGILTIAASVASTLLVLSWSGVVLNMMTMAGLVMALAIVVDDAVLGVTNTKRRLRRRREGRTSGRAAVLAAFLELRGPLLVATVITAMSVAPVFILDGVRGSFLKPLALSFLLAVLVSMVVALTVAPVLAAFLLGRGTHDIVSPVARWLEGGYGRLLAGFVRRPVWSYATAGLVVAAGLGVLPMLGTRPMSPTLQDRDLLIHWEGVPGTSRPEMIRITSAASTQIRAIPGVRNVGGQVGRAMSSDRIVNINSAELWVSLDPAADYHQTVAAVERVVDGYPGLHRDVVTYSDQRVRQVVNSGPSEDLVVRLYGNDYGVLKAKAQEVAQILSGVDGITRPRVQTQGDAPTVEIEVSVAKAARYGLKPGDVRRSAATLVSGTIAGSLFEDQKVFDVVVWGVPAVRQNLSSIGDLMIDAPAGGLVRLGDVAQVRIQPSPQVITHDQVSRSIDVVADVRRRGLDAVTADVRHRLQQVRFPHEHHLEVLGESQARQSANLVSLSYVIGAAVAIFFLLQATFGSWRLALLLFPLLPVALVGGVLLAVVARDRMSTVALMGLFAVVAIAVRGGLLQITNYQRLERENGRACDRELVLLGSRQRFAPTVTSALATGLALVPLLAYGSVTGLEIIGPLDLVIVGGLVTATLLNLFVVPGMYLRFVATSQIAREAAPSPGPPPPPGSVPPPRARPAAADQRPGTDPAATPPA
jgi:Cu/Ag efflux pump CusA